MWMGGYYMWLNRPAPGCEGAGRPRPRYIKAICFLRQLMHILPNVRLRVAKLKGCVNRVRGWKLCLAWLI